MGSTKDRIVRTIFFLIIALHVMIVMAPFVWLLYSSLKTNKEFMASVWNLPAHLNWGNYATAWGEGALGVYMLNSVIVCVVTVGLTVIVSTSAGFCLGTRRRLKWVPKVEFVLLATMTIPAYVSLVPIVQTMKAIGLMNTRLGVILPTLAFNVPMSIFIMRSFFVTMPYEIIEAANFDGASEPRIFFSIAVPLAKPAMFTAAIINVIWVWNDFLFPLVIINSPRLKTLPVGLRDYVGEHVTNYPVMISAVIIASLGALVVYTLFQKQVIGGLMNGAIKA